VRSLFATVLAISASTSALPAIANPISNPISSQISTSSIPAKNIGISGSNQFTQRSLNLAKQIPTDVIGLVMMDLEPKSWQMLDTSQATDPVTAIDKLLTSFGQLPQISIVKDIQPWLGKEVLIAFFSNTDNKFEFTFTALSTISDDKKFEFFLKKLKSLDLPKPIETLYQNVKILEWQLEEDSVGDKKPVLSHKLNSRNSLQSLLRLKQNTPTNTKDNEEDSDPEEIEPTTPIFLNFSIKRFAIAKLPSGIAVISTNRQMIQKMIDTSAEMPEQRLPSLADNPLFLRSLNNPLWNRSLIAGYGDFKELGKISEHPIPKDSATRDRLLSYLPSNVYGAITSRNLNRQWQWFVEESKQQSTYKILVEGVRMLVPLMIGAGFDLDIEKDIISWIDGEYAVVVFPSDRSPFQETGIDLTIGALIRTSKPEVANATLAKLTKQLSKLSGDFIQVKKRQIGATVLTSFEFPDTRESGKTQSIFAYGWRDRQTLMLTLGANTASAFIPIPKPALAESEMFRDAISDMPQPNFGYFYLNVNAIAKQVATLGFLLFASNSDIPPSQDKSSQPVLPDEIKKVIDRLGGAVFVYSETSDRFQSDLFFGLKP